MSEKIVPISDLRRAPGQVVETIREGSGVVYITQYGRPAAVLIGYEAYEAMQEKLRTAGRKETQVEERPASYSLQALADLAEDLGVDDLAENHDAYLYGSEGEA